MVSDRGLLSWFSSYAQKAPALQNYLSNTLDQFSLPSLNLYASIVATTSNCNVLDAMRLMSEQGVSSVAVLDEDTGMLMSAVSVTDIGQVSHAMQYRKIRSSYLPRLLFLPKAIRSCQCLFINSLPKSRHVIFLRHWKTFILTKLRFTGTRWLNGWS
jgi:hypothetical protein